MEKKFTFSIDGYHQYFEELQAESDDVQLQLYHMAEYVENARMSGEYAEDRLFRKLIDEVAIVLEESAKKEAPMIAELLNQEMELDAVKAELRQMSAAQRKILLPLFLNGNRHPDILKMLRTMVLVDLENGWYKGVSWHYLKPQDFEVS